MSAHGIRARPAACDVKKPDDCRDQRHKKDHAIDAERHRCGGHDAPQNEPVTKQIKRHQRGALGTILDQQEQWECDDGQKKREERRACRHRGRQCRRRQALRKRWRRGPDPEILMAIRGIRGFRHAYPSQHKGGKRERKRRAEKRWPAEPRDADPPSVGPITNAKAVTARPNAQRTPALCLIREDERTIESDAGKSSAEPRPLRPRARSETRSNGDKAQPSDGP